MTAYCMVFFQSGACDLDTAFRSLTSYGLTVTRRDDELVVGRSGSPDFRVRHARADWVRAEAAEISEGTPHAAAMQECSELFEISFDNLDEVLDEINTLIEIHRAPHGLALGKV
ncbi:hypothetical protein J8F10_12475 [Gemmata sp. G18]|uniref:Uncharacterized protein n=1 Tax=Gemmata palustris TaxID=2822762 RepID=A0ABS5BTB3_9BACT|nr:hypothetical protein [Gemmata palustris]MBP3956098.1 hypothetical protein [Gemmata palustris]